MAYGFWRVLMKQCSKARLGMQNNSSSLDEDVSSNTRCTKSFDGQTWKVNESLNLSTNISSTSTTTIATDSCRHTVDLRMAGLKKVITMNADDCSSVNDRVCETLCRGEVRKSRSKMKSYLKRCKDVLSGGVNSTIFSNVSEEPSSMQKIVAYQKMEVPTLQSSSTSCWYLEDHPVELRPEDNREPYSSLASARLKLETEEFRLEQEALANSKDTSETTVMIKSSSTMQEIVNTEADACMAVPQDDLKHCQIETVANENSSFDNIDIKLKIHHQEQQDSTQLLSGSLSSAHRCIERLIDQCLGPLYPEYVDHTRPILIRQARDLLVCIYHGDLERFETQFLRPATDIVRKLRCVYQQGKNLSWIDGWPLAVSGALVLHLGAFDESLVRSQDTYLCIHPEQPTNKPELYAVWRSAASSSEANAALPPPIVYRRLDPLRDPITPLAVEMLTEDLASLLQNLLVGIERAISRVPLENLSFPVVGGPSSVIEAPEDGPEADSGAVQEPGNDVGGTGDGAGTYIVCPGTPKIGLKRRELITKNNKLLINSKYTQLKRTSVIAAPTAATANTGTVVSSLPVSRVAPAAVAGSHDSSGVSGNQNATNAAITRPLRKSENAPTAATTPAIITNSNQQQPRNDGMSVAICDTGGGKSDGDDNHQSSSDVGTAVGSMPLFCLGGSFPHIDSDEESSDEQKTSENAPHFPHEIVAPRSIRDLPEKLLTSGISIPGTHDRSGSPIIYIEVEKTLASSLNCYEMATVLLYYNTLPIQRPPYYTLHLLINESSQLSFLETIESTLQLLEDHLKLSAVFVSGAYDPTTATNIPPKEHLRPGKVRIRYLNKETIKNFISTDNLPIQCCGFYVHDQREWIDFFALLEPLQQACVEAGRQLVAVLGDLRTMEIQQQQSGTVSTRRQLHSQHRALSRALMDSELQSLRRKGPTTVQRLQDKLTVINNKQTLIQTKNLVRAYSVDSNTRSVSGASIHTTTGMDGIPATAGVGTMEHQQQDVISGRLTEVIAIYSEVDRVARKLEQLTEQRRERLREMTRQRALDEEINEVISWVRHEGELSLCTFGDSAALDCAEMAKEREQQFEQFYFIASKHLSKGRDLCDASGELEVMRDNLKLLKDCCDEYQERLERVRERIEGAGRLHALLGMQQLKLDDDIRTEMLKLAEQIEAPKRLVERCRLHLTPVPSTATGALEEMSESQSHELISNVSSSNVGHTHNTSSTSDNISLDISMDEDTITATSTPEKAKLSQTPQDTVIALKSIPAEQTTDHSNLEDRHHEEYDHQTTRRQQLHHHNHHHHHRPDEEDEELSKMADSGLGGCVRCDGNAKLERTCSCQSFDDAKNACNNSDDLDEDCFEGISKPSLDLQIPLQANAHLYCHASNLQLDYEENNPFDQKTQKTLLLIMREMIGTERDYVRSLQYVIENYTQELLREDIPQALRGQRNVIFGNIERICEFHRQHFLCELESCGHHPLKVGAAFLRHESKFYLYALYNKNKPKSDSLMSENGTQFFKAKQIELNDKMDLASYLLKPVQRMGKYALLLQQLMKACAEVQHTNGNQEIVEDLEMLQKAEEMVRFQLRHGNDLLAMDSLRDCDVNVKEQGRLLRQNEFIVWEGKAGKKSLRQVFLFEELVLFSKARRFPDRKNLDIYIYKNSIKTSDIGLTAHVGDSPYRFEIWFRKRKPGDTWTLQTMSEDVKNAWTEEVSKLLWKQAKRNREIRLAEMSSMGIGSKPCLDIRPSQDQINDRSISFSQLGKVPKLRYSFMGTLPESKSSKRPQSIISLSSSSSGSSSVSTSTGSTTSGFEARTVSVSGNSSYASSSSACNSSSGSSNSCASSNASSTTTSSITTCKRLTLNPNVPAPLKTNYKKHQRSTTLVSQCSMESGIIADISLSPDEVLDNPHWPHHSPKYNHLPSNVVINSNVLKNSNSLTAASGVLTPAATVTASVSSGLSAPATNGIQLEGFVSKLSELETEPTQEQLASKTNVTSTSDTDTTITVHL